MKKSFILYNDQEQLFNQLTDAEAGILIKAIFKSNHSKVELKDRMLQILLTTVLQQIDRDAIKYADKCKKLRENGSKGGKARAENAKQLQANVSLNDNDNNNPTLNEVENYARHYASEKSLSVHECLHQAKAGYEYYHRQMDIQNKRTWHDSNGNKIKNWKLKLANIWFKDIKSLKNIGVNKLNVC